MLIAPKPTPLSILSTFNLLRHILAVHLQLPDMIAPLSSTPARDDNEVLRLASDALADIVGDTAEDSRLLARAQGQIATLLHNMPTVFFKDGAFVVLPAGSPGEQSINA
jgi:hypothetical protein